MLVPFGKFEPDKSRFNISAAPSVINAKPTADGWGPLPTLSALSDALASECLGAIAVINNAGTVKVFAGTATKLYELNNTTLAWTDSTRSVGGNYTVASGDRWVFALFGDKLIATQDGDVPQFVDIDLTNAFADLTNASFQAKTVTAVGDFLVFGNLTSDPCSVRWSGLNDITHWTNGEKGADTQSFPEGGHVQSIIEQTPHAVMFQEDNYSNMIFDPASDYTFRFETINSDRGAWARYSTVGIGPGDYVYLAKDGFYRTNMPIGAERVDRWFFDKVDQQALWKVRAVADPFEKLAWWRFEDESADSFLLGYDWQLDKWCYAEASNTELLQGFTAGYTLEALDAFGTIDTLPASLDARQWQGGSPGFAGFTSDHKYGFFNGTNLAAIIETEDKQLNYPSRALTNRFTSLVDNNNFTIAVAGRETPQDTPAFGSDISPETNTPWCHSLVSGRYHRFRVKIPSNEMWNNAVGIDVEFTGGGRW